mgnify:CR=1 FL=1
MPAIGAIRQITLTTDPCRAADIDEPGHHFRSFVDDDGRITSIKHTPGAAAGLLKSRNVHQRINDDESILNQLESTWQPLDLELFRLD